MAKPTLLILAAGMGSRYGGLKQLDAMGPGGETVLDYSVFDAIRAGFGKVVFVIRRDFEQVFREQIGARFQDKIEVGYAFQALDDLPQGFSVPEGRDKPWGTGHAVRAAREVIDGPFCMINADDFYGRDSYERMARWLESRAGEEGGKLRLSMVAFELGKTLSDHGSVARGVCTVDGSRLVTVTEKTKIERAGAAAENREDEAAPEPLALDTPVSMNFWGFPAALFGELEQRFIAFLTAKGGETKSEWYIPFIVDDLLREGRASVEVLRTDSDWFGVTYREDKELVQAEIAKLIEAGEYPRSLWEGSNQDWGHTSP